MATKLANYGGPNPHTAGIFADMTIDGPEIGTLVLVVDRAKNLPNRKAMGKQNPYCAARLGKEAKKTETDRRGGQTPRWDQELRFTVHDSPDYHQIKISVFSEDKRTDLVGEAWVSLTEVVVPGGGKSDLWQGLNCKGKYAGELRIELTYYDTRPKPEKEAESVVGAEEFRHSIGPGSSSVKRRPLPSNPTSGHVTPDTIPSPAHPGRAKHGPRDFRTPPRANSMPPETLSHSHPQYGYGAPAPFHPHSHGGSPAQPLYQTPPNEYYGEYDQYQELQWYDDSGFSQPMQPDFLPQLPPSNRQRASLPQHPRFDASRQGQPLPHRRPLGQMNLPHSHSAPVVPQADADPQDYETGYQLRTDYPEPIPDLEYQHQQLEVQQRRRSEIPPAWQNEYIDPYATRQAYTEEESQAPPPPPMHSNSAPVVPHYTSSNSHLASSPAAGYGAQGSNTRHHTTSSIPNSSPLQNIECTYGTQQRTPVHGHPPRGASLDSYTPSPEQRGYDGSPSNYPPGQTPSPFARPQPATRPLPNRHSIADPYSTTTPPRPHPLSQEVPRSRSPQPHYAQELPGSSPQSNGYSPYEHNFRSRDGVPLVKPRPISPGWAPPQSNSAPRPRSSYSIQHPVRAFESCDNSPLATSQPNPKLAHATTPMRKSVSPHPTPPGNTGSAVPFSPDSYDIHNPNARQSLLGDQVSPHTPYQVRPGSEAHPRGETNGPIVGWHGQEIDPSDHLPVDSWAPEPEKKTPTKTYGLGRDRDFGPRSVNSATSSGGRNLSKDTVVNVRMKSHSQPEPEPTPSRNRLQKKNGPGKSPIIEPLRERHNFNSVTVPDPYAQQEYSRGFYQSNDRGHNNGYGQSGALPTDALTREISSIDIGSGRHSRTGSAPSPVAYVPVRSHKDRNTYY